MNTHKKINKMLTAYVLGELSPTQNQQIQTHLAQCQTCTHESKRLESVLLCAKDLHSQSVDDNAVEAAKARLFTAVSNERTTQSAGDKQSLAYLWRTIMKARITKFAVAAMVVVIAGLAFTFLDSSNTAAYAFEQTMQASHSVRTLHIKEFRPGEDEPKEIWVECDSSGNVKIMRAHLPLWESPEDGAKEALWAQGKADVWLKRKNVLVTVKEQTVNEKIQKLFIDMDPRFAVENLSKEQLDGTVDVTITRPDDAVSPIVVTATWTAQSATPNKRTVLYIDPKTKLVNAAEEFEKSGDEYQLKNRLEYYDYNVPLPEEIFRIEGVPANVMRIDQTTKAIGTIKGEKSEEEIAYDVVQQFLNAMIAEDYNKAGLLYEGIPAEKLKPRDGGKIVRIVSIGKPEKYILVGGYKVPCKIEIEKEGQKIEYQPPGIFVHQVSGQPERWTVCGGF